MKVKELNLFDYLQTLTQIKFNCEFKVYKNIQLEKPLIQELYIGKSSSRLEDDRNT